MSMLRVDTLVGTLQRPDQEHTPAENEACCRRKPDAERLLLRRDAEGPKVMPVVHRDEYLVGAPTIDV